MLRISLMQHCSTSRLGASGAVDLPGIGGLVGGLISHLLSTVYLWSILAVDEAISVYDIHDNVCGAYGSGWRPWWSMLEHAFV